MESESPGENMESNFRIPELIMKKRNGDRLSKEEIDYFIKEVSNGGVQDSQLGAMLMAIYLQNLSRSETVNLTRSMMMSGETLSWPEEWSGLVVDKHSTGGVGDKVSLILAPALAACGMKVPMISGRGLGHTGGTLDKLESIPGFNVHASPEKMKEILEDVGCCIVGQTKNLVPADKRMYAVRDISATVDHLPLITSSILSKKAAERLDALILDVKYGNGSFLTDIVKSKELAQNLMSVGVGLGITTGALLTDMNSPLGKTVGNVLEVKEAVECLQGGGPPDLIDIVAQLGAHLLFSVGKNDVKGGSKQILDTLQSGAALEKFCHMMKAQGVDSNIADKICSEQPSASSVLPKSKFVTEIVCDQSGYIHSLNAMSCAVVCGKLGAGRAKAGDPINFGVGLEIIHHIGDQVTKGSTWIKVHHDCKTLPANLHDLLQSAVVIQDDLPYTSISSSRVYEVLI